MTDSPMHAHNRQAAKERSSYRRAQQGPPPTPDEIRQALGTFAEQLGEHVDHGGWHEVSPCVYCGCGARLYNGKVPGAKRCTPGAHEWDNADSMGQGGFYYLCLHCGEKEWT